jgi:hypothetical protein
MNAAFDLLVIGRPSVDVMFSGLEELIREEFDSQALPSTSWRCRIVHCREGRCP